MKTRTNTTRSVLLGLAGLAVVAGMVGCRGDREDKPPRQIFPDMDDQPKWKPQGKSQFFTDGRIMRQPVTGTVAFGREGWSKDPNDGAVNPKAAARAEFLKEGQAAYEGMEGNQYVQTIPVRVDEALVLEGQKNFNIYCAACHGYMGDGKGLVGPYFTVTPVNLHDAKYRVGGEDPLSRDGYIFSVIRNGVRSMPPYAHALTEHETWGVVAYMRALQHSTAGTLADVQDAAQRTELERQMNLPDPAAAGTPASTTSPTTPTAPAAQPAAPAPAAGSNGGAK